MPARTWPLLSLATLALILAAALALLSVRPPSWTETAGTGGWSGRAPPPSTPAASAPTPTPGLVAMRTPTPAGTVPGCDGMRLSEGAVCLMATSTPPPCYSSQDRPGEPCVYREAFAPTATPWGVLGER
jgi:hypothetical protein